MAKITAEVEVWTPQKAQAILDLLNEHQRKKSRIKVNEYAAAYRSGTFRETGQPVIVDTNGHLQDGQHRLQALVDAGVTRNFLTVRGANPDDFAVIDRGLSRKASQFLGAYGTTKVSAWKRVRAMMGTSSTGRGVAIDKTTDQALIINDITDNWNEVFDKYRTQVESTHRASAVPAAPLLAVAAVADLYGHHQDMIDSFLEGIKTGVGLGTHDPRRLIMQAWRGGNRNLTVDEHKALVYVVKAWNAYAEGRTMKQLKYNNGDIIPVVL